MKKKSTKNVLNPGQVCSSKGMSPIVKVEEYLQMEYDDDTVSYLIVNDMLEHPDSVSESTSETSKWFRTRDGAINDIAMLMVIVSGPTKQGNYLVATLDAGGAPLVGWHPGDELTPVKTITPVGTFAQMKARRGKLERLQQEAL